MADENRIILQRQITPKKLSFIRRKSSREKESALLRRGSSPQSLRASQKDLPAPRNSSDEYQRELQRQPPSTERKRLPSRSPDTEGASSSYPAVIEKLTSQGSPERGNISKKVHPSGSIVYNKTPSQSTKTSTPQEAMQRKTVSSWNRSEAIALHQKLVSVLEQAKAKLANIAGILMELSESYYDLMGGWCWCCRLCQLDVVVQESLAAYERRVVGQDQSNDINEWTNLIACQIEGRCRRNTVLAKHTSRGPSSYDNMSDSMLKAEITQMDGDATLYEKRIERDEAKIKELGTNWASDKQTGNFFRLCRLKSHVRKAIMDYSMDLI